MNPYASRRRNLKPQGPETVADSSDNTDAPEDEGDRSSPVPTRFPDTTDPVETALAGALTEASRAGRFDVVALLARELEARRLAPRTS